MYTIYEPILFEQTINKSRFFCYLFPVKSVEEANAIIGDIRKKHYDATHNCYSYRIGTEEIIAKSSDDGEPSKTAGMPIFEVLRKNDLTDILAVVTRYFGGIKLGAGGLIRAYGSSVALALENAKFIKIEKRIEMILILAYSQLPAVERIIRIYQEISRNFGEKIEIIISVPSELADALSQSLIDATKGTIEIIIKN